MRETFGVVGATLIAPLAAPIYFGIQQWNVVVMAYSLALLWIALLCPYFSLNAEAGFDGGPPPSLASVLL
jgi:hypothetical protein